MCSLRAWGGVSVRSGRDISQLGLPATFIGQNRLCSLFWGFIKGLQPGLLHNARGVLFTSRGKLGLQIILNL